MDLAWMHEERRTNGARKSQASQRPAQAPARGADVAGSPPTAGTVAVRAVRSPQALTPADVLALQRTIGNAAVNWLIQSGAAQPQPALQRASGAAVASQPVRPQEPVAPPIQRIVGADVFDSSTRLFLREGKSGATFAAITAALRTYEGTLANAAPRVKVAHLQTLLATLTQWSTSQQSEGSSRKQHVLALIAEVQAEIATLTKLIPTTDVEDAAKKPVDVAAPEAVAAPAPEAVAAPAPVAASVMPEAAPSAAQPSSGLAAAAPTTAFAKAAYDFWQDAANKNKPLHALSDLLMATANAELPYPCQHTYVTSGDTGAFNQATWTVEINTAKFSERPGVSKVGDLTQDEVAEMVDTIYHEARHSEQFFRVAQIQSGRGKTVREIMKRLSIPPKVATAADWTSLEINPWTMTKADRALLAEGKGWEHFLSGKYARYQTEINDLRDEIEAMRDVFVADDDDATKIANLDPEINEIEAHLSKYFDKKSAGIKKIEKKDAFDEAVLKHIENIRSAFDALKAEFDQQKADATKRNVARLANLARDLHQARYDAYRDFEHEKDAWAVGGAAAAAFKKQAKKAE